MFAICNLSVVPVRKTHDDKSEIVTQWLFGETAEITGTHKQWRKIKISYDQYEGWIDSKQMCTLELEEYKILQEQPPTYCMDLIQVIVQGDAMFPISMGSTLPYYKNNSCVIGDVEFQFKGHAKQLKGPAMSKLEVLQNAKAYINAPYLWGGKTPLGIDCSGFTQMVYKVNGVKLPRDAWQQAEQGKTLNFIQEAEPGDLAFFDNENGKITHVGIILAENKIIHASGRVRIDMLDHHGIFNEKEKKYTHKLRLIKQYF